MSILESRREYAAKEAWAAENAERIMAEDFEQAAMKADASAFAAFAPLVTDWTHGIAAANTLPKRMPTFAEVMAESLDFDDGPSLHEAMQALLNLAYGSVPLETQREQARHLIERMASAFARINSGLDG